VFLVVSSFFSILLVVGGDGVPLRLPFRLRLRLRLRFALAFAFVVALRFALALAFALAFAFAFMFAFAFFVCVRACVCVCVCVLGCVFSLVLCVSGGVFVFYDSSLLFALGFFFRCFGSVCVFGGSCMSLDAVFFFVCCSGVSPALRVPRAETRLTVYRALYIILLQINLPAGGVRHISGFFDLKIFILETIIS